MSRVRDVLGPIRILIADDHENIRAVVRSLLQSHPRFHVCGEATNGNEAITLAKKLRPHVIVMNISMPEKNGFDAAQFILASSDYRPAIVILSNHMDELLVRESKRIGAQGFVTKSEAYSNSLWLQACQKFKRGIIRRTLFRGASL